MPDRCNNFKNYIQFNIDLINVFTKLGQVGLPTQDSNIFYAPKITKLVFFYLGPKKGSAQILGNYRPVSCLPAASKLLKIVVCSQLSEYLESNDLLPRNQHGFRPMRSTMTAWNEIQLDWA